MSASFFSIAEKICRFGRSNTLRLGRDQRGTAPDRARVGIGHRHQAHDLQSRIARWPPLGRLKPESSGPQEQIKGIAKSWNPTAGIRPRIPWAAAPIATLWREP